MRELPFNTQVENVKNVLNQLILIFQDNQFSTKDIIQPPFRHLVGFGGGRINLPKVLNHLNELGEIIIVREDNSYIFSGGWECGIIEFKVTEKYGKLPEIKVSIPVPSHMITSFNDELPKMMKAYGLLASFENKIRFFIASYLEKTKGVDWWESCIPADVKKNIKTHRLQNWHIQLPKSNIQYTDFSDLIKIINKNWDVFEEVFKEQALVKTYFESLEVPRNTIAHSNVLSESMFQELELYSNKLLNIIELFK